MREKVKAKVLVALWCPTLCDPIDCNSPGSSVRGILQTSTGVGGHSLSPGDLPNLDSGLLYCRRILYHLSHEGSPNRASYLTIYIYIYTCITQFSSIAQSCPTLCNPVDWSKPGFPVHHQLLELTQTHVYLVNDAIQPSHPLLSPSPPAFNLSQHQGLFQWVSSSHQVAKVLELQLQHQSSQWIFRTDFL